MKNKDSFELSLTFFISIVSNYDYTMDYMENVARNFTKMFPTYLIHKKSEDKIKAFMTDTVKAKVEKFANAEAKVVNITDIREIADLVAEYEGMEGAGKSPFGSHPTGSPSMGPVGLDLAMSVDIGSSDIRPVGINPPKTSGSSKPKIMKRSVIRIMVELEVAMDTKQYLYFLQELPEIFSFNEFQNLRSRLVWKQNRTTYNEQPIPVEVRLVEDRKFRPWFITCSVLLVFCIIGIISLFFSIPNLYKQDIHFMRSDTIHQEVSISNSRIDLDNVTMTRNGTKDTLIIKDKKLIIAK